jgi:hypothetical protein
MIADRFVGLGLRSRRQPCRPPASSARQEDPLPRPEVLQHLGAKIASTIDARRAHAERFDVSGERGLQVGAVVLRAVGLLRGKRVGGEADQTAPLESAGEEELPPGVAGFGGAWRQNVLGEIRGGLAPLWKAAAAAAADPTHHGVAAFDVVGEPVQRRRLVVVAKGALHAHRHVVRLQVVGQRVVGGGEFAGHGREENSRLGRARAFGQGRSADDPGTPRGRNGMAARKIGGRRGYRPHRVPLPRSGQRASGVIARRAGGR